jgi:hypothetical protein
VRSGPIYWGVFTLHKRFEGDGILRVKSPKNIICDGFLHVNMFYYFKSPILHVHFLQNLSTMNILDTIFYCTLVLNFSPVNSLSGYYENTQSTLNLLC